MNPYKFETEQFGISDTAIHLLRSGFNYETISFDVVEEIYIGEGRQLKNWIIVCLFGISLVLVGCYTLYNIFYDLFIGHQLRFYIQELLIPVGPFLAGVYCIYISFKHGWIMKVKTKNKSKVFSIDALRKQSGVEELSVFLLNNHLTTGKMKV